jgi:hypothetical protein
MVSGGGFTAVMNVWLENSKSKRDARDKDLDERISTWRLASEKNEVRIDRLEKLLVVYERDFRSLERYILSLEQIIVRDAPSLMLPERPLLEKDTFR